MGKSKLEEIPSGEVDISNNIGKVSKVEFVLSNEAVPRTQDSNLSNAITESCKKANDSSFSEQRLHANVVNGTVLKDLKGKKWLLGEPIGHGAFGEVFLASDNITMPTTDANAKFVVKLEPHFNGPLFVEINCLMNISCRKSNNEQKQQHQSQAKINIPVNPSAIPDYIASGSHLFANVKYRFLVLPRFDHDLHSLIKNCCLHKRYLVSLAVLVIDALEELHNKGYCHNDIKAQNLMLSKCHYKSDKKMLTSDSNSKTSTQDESYENDTNDCQEGFIKRVAFKRKRRTQRNSNNIIAYNTKPVSSNYRILRSHNKLAMPVVYGDTTDILPLQIAKKARLATNEWPTSNLPTTSTPLKDTNTATACNLVQDNSIDDEERLFLIDFGLASKYIYDGVHFSYEMDLRRAHDGTLEFTSRDAHMGMHSRRSDLECLGYNLLFWSQGYLPWKKAASRQETENVHCAKEFVMTNVHETLKQFYGNELPTFLADFLHEVNQLGFYERPNYEGYRHIFRRAYEQLGFSSKDMKLNSNEIVRTCVMPKEQVKNKPDILEKTNLNASTELQDISVGTPFQENTVHNRMTTRNRRSLFKSTKKNVSAAEIFLQNPDQIALKRSEREYGKKDEGTNSTPRRYEGYANYAILAVLQLKKQQAEYVEQKKSNFSKIRCVEEKKENQENKREQRKIK